MTATRERLKSLNTPASKREGRTAPLTHTRPWRSTTVVLFDGEHHLGRLKQDSDRVAFGEIQFLDTVLGNRGSNQLAPVEDYIHNSHHAARPERLHPALELVSRRQTHLDASFVVTDERPCGDGLVAP